jgi:hypothetical protein
MGEVQHLKVVRVQHVFIMLEPVARSDRRTAAANAGIIGLNPLAFRELLEASVVRQNGLLLARTHVSPDEAALLLHRIPGLAHRFAHGWTILLGHLHVAAATFNIEKPAMIGTADTLILDPPVVQRRATVAAS